MNETIGVKGGHNDHRRTLKIEQQKKKKLDERIKDEKLRELEKQVKKNQIYTLIKVLPIAIAGGTFKTLYDAGKIPFDKEEDYSKWRIKEYDADITNKAKGERVGTKPVIITTSTGRKVVVHVEDESKKATLPTILEDIILHPTIKEQEKKEEQGLEQKQEIINDKVKEPKTKKGIAIHQTDDELEIKDNNPKFKMQQGIDFTSLSEKSQSTLLKLKNRKIIEEYEKQLKDVRYELRKLVSDYNMLVEQSEEIVVSKEAQVILDKLTEIISRIEELKRKIKIDDLDKYDDNYIYVLVEGYLEEFKDKRLVKEIKDSPLYVMISEKLEELDEKKEMLSENLERKKEELSEKEIEFDNIKSKYLNINKINSQLLAFQDEQDRLLRELEEKVKNATSVKEKVEVQFEGMTRQSRRALRLLRLQMLLPGPLAAKSFAATSAAYLHFMNQILHPRTKTTKYKVVTVKDYSDQINDSISQIDNAEYLLSKTSTQIDKIISDIKTRFKDYIGVIKECDELLYNLEKIKQDLKEKEYEMQKTKEEQQLVEEKNNALVKKRGEYKM